MRQTQSDPFGGLSPDEFLDSTLPAYSLLVTYYGPTYDDFGAVRYSEWTEPVRIRAHTRDSAIHALHTLANLEGCAIRRIETVDEPMAN